jgi:hypothetical protein
VHVNIIEVRQSVVLLSLYEFIPHTRIALSAFGIDVSPVSSSLDSKLILPNRERSCLLFQLTLDCIYSLDSFKASTIVRKGKRYRHGLKPRYYNSQIERQNANKNNQAELAFCR